MAALVCFFECGRHSTVTRIASFKSMSISQVLQIRSESMQVDYWHNPCNDDLSVKLGDRWGAHIALYRVKHCTRAVMHAPLCSSAE
jgi:hypothetical protein